MTVAALPYLGSLPFTLRLLCILFFLSLLCAAPDPSASSASSTATSPQYRRRAISDPAEASVSYDIYPSNVHSSCCVIKQPLKHCARQLNHHLLPLCIRISPHKLHVCIIYNHPRPPTRPPLCLKPRRTPQRPLKPRVRAPMALTNPRMKTLVSARSRRVDPRFARFLTPPIF